MKLILVAALCAVCDAVGLRSVHREDPEPGKPASASPAVAQPDATPTAPSAIHEAFMGAASTKTGAILKEIKKRISRCETNGPLKDVPLDALFDELRAREAANRKQCDIPPPTKKEKPADPPAPKPVTTKTTTPTTTTTTTSCPDNFMDELVDQANVEFTKLDADEDGCVSSDEMTRSLEKAHGAVEENKQYYWKLKDTAEGTKDMQKDLKTQVEEADKNQNGCLEKDELQHVRFAACDCKTQFGLMDQNGDEQISLGEGTDYVEAHMKHADLSHDTFMKIWKAANVDKDNFLNYDEFCSAGSRYKGDGNNEEH